MQHSSFFINLFGKLMFIDAYLTPYFPETEDQFKDSIVIMIDVLRASSTVCAALFNNAKEVISTETPEKAIKIYSSLSKESRFLGGERNSIKVDGFDAGNSPFEYTRDKVSNKSVILTTTNGTQIFQKAKFAEHKLVGAFVNFSAIIGFIKSKTQEKNHRISFLCAGTNGRMAYEDTLCAGAFIDEIHKFLPDYSLTDTADASKNLYNLHSENMQEFIKQKQHPKSLIELGLVDDVDFCLTKDSFPVVPVISGASIKKL